MIAQKQKKPAPSGVSTASASGGQKGRVMKRLVQMMAPLWAIVFCILVYSPSARAGNQCPECQALPTPAQRANCVCPETKPPPQVEPKPEPTPTPTPTVKEKKKPRVKRKVVPGCTPGTLNCKCRPDDTCDEPLECVAGDDEKVCLEPCEEGQARDDAGECKVQCEDGSLVDIGKTCPPKDCGEGITVAEGEDCPHSYLVATRKACEEARDEVDWLKWLESGYFLLLLLLLLLLIGLLVWKMNKMEKENHELRQLLEGNLPPDGGGPDPGMGEPPSSTGLPRPPSGSAR